MRRDKKRGLRKTFISVLLLLILMISVLPASSLESPWNYTYGYPENLQPPADSSVVGLWISAEPIEQMSIFNNTHAFGSYSYYAKDGFRLQYRLWLHEDGKADFLVQSFSVYFDNWLPKREAIYEAGYHTENGRLILHHTAGAEDYAHGVFYLCPIFGGCVECDNSGGHRYTVEGDTLNLEYRDRKGGKGVLPLKRWTPGQSALTESDVLWSKEFVEVHQRDIANAAEKDGVLPASILLDVPYLHQGMPSKYTGRSRVIWDNNCGQTSCVMVEAYYKKSEARVERVIEVNRVTGVKAGDPILASGEKSYTFGKSTNFSDYSRILGEMMGLGNPIIGESGTLNDVKRVLAKGNPVIVVLNVRYKKGGAPQKTDFHAVVIIGYDDENGEIIIHDPGTSNGKEARYGYDEFERNYWVLGKKYAYVEGN